MSDCCDPIVPPRNCTPRCNPQVSTDCVIDPSAYSCLGLGPESTQSEINAALIETLCNMDPTSLCPTFVDIDLASGWFTSDGGQHVASSNPIGCIVRLHGLAEKEFGYFVGDEGCHQYKIILTTSLTPSHVPTYPKALSLNVIVKETNSPGINKEHLFPALLIILPNGYMTLNFYVDHCLSSLNSPYKIITTLDGLTYETN